jgi:hypothetical protein
MDHRPLTASSRRFFSAPLMLSVELKIMLADMLIG